MSRVMMALGLALAWMAAGCTDGSDTPMTAAALDNDAAALRKLMADGHPPDEMGRGGMTALMWAARAGALDAMKALVDAGADPNRFDGRSTGWPPLLHAIHTRQRAAAQLLLEHGADPNLRADGLTPLLMAAADPDGDLVALLLAHGANAQFEGKAGRTPLTEAVAGGALRDVVDRPMLGGCHAETVRALLAHDPSLALPANFAGREAMFWARYHGCHEVLHLMTK
jgi:ankyrin repeat protein